MTPASGATIQFVDVGQGDCTVVDGVVGWEYQQPYDVLMRIHPPLPGVAGTSQGLTETGAQAALRWSLTGIVARESASAVRREHRRSKASSPSWWARAGFVGLSSKDEHLAEREGFEPSIRLPAYHLSKMAH